MDEVKFVADAVIKTARAADTAMRRAWSLMEAATEKQRPSEVMSREAIRRMQGRDRRGRNEVRNS